MEETNKYRRIYQEYVKAYLARRHITKTANTLIWLRDQKEQSRVVKQEGLEKVILEIGVLDEMISGIKNGGEK